MIEFTLPETPKVVLALCSDHLEGEVQRREAQTYAPLAGEWCR
ncbi:MAG: hypothetical protein WCP07_03085 [bacterium]